MGSLRGATSAEPVEVESRNTNEADWREPCDQCGFPHPGQPCPASRLGDLLANKYRLMSILGVGGMGVVYAARHELVGRRFAIKVLHASALHHPASLRRFRREAQAAGSIENEHIAAVTDFGTANDGTAFLVMEFLQGEDLSHTLAREGPLSVERALGIALQVCRGLAAAHAQGIVHRDLKPANLFLCRREDGSELVKLLDFGIAKLQAKGAESTTRTGAMIGTPYYMPPEQARGRRDLDHRADIYALGTVLYELLSGEKAHPGDSYNEILYHVLMETPRPLCGIRLELEPELCDVIERAMASDADDRYASVDELARGLSECLAGLARAATTPAQAPTT